MQGLANQQPAIIGDDDAHHVSGGDHPYRTVRSPFNSLVRQGDRSRSGVKPLVARGCP